LSKSGSEKRKKRVTKSGSKKRKKRMTKRGKVYISSIQRGKLQPRLEGVKNVNVTSGSMNKFDGASAKEMSPMYLGPVGDCLLFENYWQYGKKFKELGHAVSRDKWLKFRERGCKRKKGDRHPSGTKSKEVLYQYEKNGKTFNKWRYYVAYIAEYGGIEMGYIEARKRVYVPVYSELVSETNAFKGLKKLVDSGQSVMILDYDGPKKTTEVTEKVLRTALNDPSRPFGHGYVIASLLI